VDIGDLETVDGAQRAYRYVAEDGIRQDVAHVYLHPRLQDGNHPNLHVVVESQVLRVLIEDGRAAGVVYRPRSLQGSSGDRPIRARKMVVVSCGAFGTPPVLERSGVGNATILRNAGIEPIVDLPGVGNGYQDHHLGAYLYRSALEPSEFFDIPAMGALTPEQMATNPMRGWNGVDITSKLRPTEHEVATMGTELRQWWENKFSDRIERPLAVMAVFNGLVSPLPSS
jgi:alcohol oxidase